MDQNTGDIIEELTLSEEDYELFKKWRKKLIKKEKKEKIPKKAHIHFLINSKKKQEWISYANYLGFNLSEFIGEAIKTAIVKFESSLYIKSDIKEFRESYPKSKKDDRIHMKIQEDLKISLMNITDEFKFNSDTEFIIVAVERYIKDQNIDINNKLEVNFTQKDLQYEDFLNTDKEQSIKNSIDESFMLDLSFHDVEDKGIYAIDKENEMHHVERIQIPFSKRLSEICQISKKLWKRAVFIGRQVYFLMTRKKYALVHQYPDLTRRIFEFMKNKLDSPKLIDELEMKLFHDNTIILS